LRSKELLFKLDFKTRDLGMNNLESSWNNLKVIDELAAQKTPVHLLHPSAKLFTTLIFIIVTASFGRYDLAALLPLVIYPMVMISLGRLPAGYLFRRLLLVLPLIFFVGIFNPILDTAPRFIMGTIAISGGMISFLSILLRVGLTVTAALILMATSGFNEIVAALLSFKVPRVFVMQLLFLYRYITVLLEETARLIRAHSLRSFGSQDNGLKYKVWGSLVGQLLLRTIHRAERIYQTMLCRGFSGKIHLAGTRKMSWRDIIYCMVWILFFGVTRVYNIPVGIGTLLMGAGK
jgi:cobalt/nickel transport system permease protein